MQTYKEMQDELIWRIQAAKNSTLYPLTRIKTLITDSHQWATTLYIWDALVRGRLTDSAVSEYYDYPTDFRDDTIMRLEMDGEKYTRKNFEDYLDWKLSNPSDTTKIFANFGRQYFIFPAPTAIGVDNITIWGAIQAASLYGDSDKTIFSMNNDSGNEAIVKKAFAVTCIKKNPNLAIAEENNAKNLLSELFSKQQKNKQRDQRLDHAHFIVPDMFAPGRGVSSTGNFSINK